MTWEEFRENARAISGIAAQKIGEVTDIAALRVRLTTVEYQLKNEYATFGKLSYQHFTTDASTPEELARHVEAIALLQKEAEALRAAIAKAKNKE